LSSRPLGATTTGCRTLLPPRDKAAKVADTLAKWDPPPSRYVIFLAGAADWSSWYSYEQPAWAGGVFVKETNNEVVIKQSGHTSARAGVAADP
jgi:hypothetical protein